MKRSAAAKLERKRIIQELLEESQIPCQSAEEIEEPTEPMTRSISTQTDKQWEMISRSVQADIKPKVRFLQTSFPVFLTLGVRNYKSKMLTLKSRISLPVRIKSLTHYSIFYFQGKNAKTQVDCGPKTCFSCQNQAAVTTSGRYANIAIS